MEDCNAVEHEIKRSNNPKNSRSSENYDRISSTARCLQLFCAKFDTAIPAGYLRFYPLHTSIIKFSDHFC